MASSRPILDLPQELIIRIASLLTTQELGPLRASCKQIERYLFNSFAREFFTKRQFMIEHESLEVLIGIANHPGLASSLQEVIIGSDMFNFEYDFHNSFKNLIQLRLSKGYVTRNVLITTGHAKAMLVEAFSKLPNLRVVGLRDFDGKGRRRDGPNARWRSWGWSLLGGVGHASPEPLFPLLISALALANAKPARIEVFLRRNAQMSADSFALMDSWNSTPVLSNLNTLMLSLGKTAYEDSLLSAGNAVLHQAPIRTFLSRLASLEHLRLNFVISQSMAASLLDWLGGIKDPLTTQSSNLIIQAPEFASLTTLDIGLARVQGPTLIRVLTRFRLQSFSLWKLYLAPDDDHPSNTEDLWPNFLIGLSTKLIQSRQLQHIMIGYCMQDVDLHSGGMVHYRPVTWVPRGTKADKKATVASEHTITYRSQQTSEAATDWLKAMSELVHVERGSESSFGGSDDGSEDGMDLDLVPDIDEDFDEDEDEDEFNSGQEDDVNEP